jgi:tetratricopeptide (TPR) repeat protein
MASEDEALLQQALSLYSSGQYADSEKAFQQLERSPGMAHRALAGVGMIRLAEGRLPEAGSFFQASLDRQANADAFYGLGYLAELDQNVPAAHSLYEKALQQNPAHADARARLQQLAPPMHAEQPTSPPPMPGTGLVDTIPPWNHTGEEWVGTPSNQPESDPNAAVFYTILSGDPSDLSEHTLRLIGRLDIENRRPRISAYPQLVLLPLPMLLLFGFFLLQFYNLSTASQHGYRGSVNLTVPIVGLGFTGFVLAVLLVQWINVVRTRYFIRSGWVRVKLGHGFFETDDKPEELTHMIDTSLQRSPWGLITNNGVLVLNFGTLGKMHFHGLARYKELEQIRTDLNNLSRMLRSNPALKGLIA